MPASLAPFWLPEKGYWAWAKGMHQMSVSFEKPYPDGVVNLFAAGCVEPPRKPLWENLQHQFASSDRLTPDMWLAAARRYGLKEETARYHQMCITAANKEHLNIERAARLLIAMAGEQVAARSGPFGQVARRKRSVIAMWACHSWAPTMKGKCVTRHPLMIDSSMAFTRTV